MFKRQSFLNLINITDLINFNFLLKAASLLYLEKMPMITGKLGKALD